jgi:hypothetical protein
LRFQTDFWLAHSNRTSPKGDVLDRWKLEQSVVLDVNGSPDVGAELGPAEFGGSWIGTP